MLDSGRAGLCGICNGDRHALVVFNLYGWTGSHDDLEAQGRTADLVRICLAELRAHNEHFYIIFTDLTRIPEDISALQEEFDANSLIDVGHPADAWGQVVDDFTCISPNSSAPTRRDFCFCCPNVFNHIVSFHIDHSSRLPVHSVLSLSITIPESPLLISKSNGPLSLPLYLID